MIAQYLTWDDEEDKAYGYTYEIKGTTEQEEYAKWLWTVTKDLSDACFRSGSTENNLSEEGYTDEEINEILNAYPKLVSTDILTAYDQCICKLKELGLEVSDIEDCDNPDVWTSTGVY